MFLLEKDFYTKVQHMFEKKMEYETTVKWVFKDNNAPCDMYVDDLINPQSCLFIMKWGACHFGGNYNKQFVYSCLSHIFANPGFYPISADAELLKEIDKNFPENREHGRGRRLYYKMNVEKFLYKKRSFINLPENYKLILTAEKENEKVILMYNGKEAGHCNGGYNEKIIEINLDVFLEDKHRNKGIGPFVCAKLIEYHLSQNHDYITWGCDDFNVRSAKCAEKLGFDLIHEDEIEILF